MKHGAIIALIWMLNTLFPAMPAGAIEAGHISADGELQAWLAPLAHLDDNSPGSMDQNPLRPLARFYRQVGFRAVWNDQAGLLPQGKTLLRLMDNASEAGLFLYDYQPFHPERIRIHGISISSFPPLARLAPHIQFDVMLSAGMLRYAHHLYRGRVRPETLSRPWLAWRRPQVRDIPVELAQALTEDRLPAYIESLHPENRAYQDLRKALARYERIYKAGGWPTIAPGPTLRIGDEGPRVEALKRRLRITGDGPADMLMVAGYDDHMQAAVKNFQQRHGLNADGFVGIRTLAELNVPVEERIHRLKLNMERWRWFPDNLGERHLMVNIPAFELSVVEADSRVDRMRTIVGRKKRQTPIMSGTMTYLEFNPYWNIPQKIARKDILPKVISDPDYLTRQGIKVFDNWDDQALALDPAAIAWSNLSKRYFPYRLRQDPSGVNALGRVKFMFPNDYSIYIHDTPGKALFGRQRRSFSSGCVRVEAPMDLAQYLLTSQGWNHERLQNVVSLGQRQSVVLNHPIPVHLVYFTAWVDEAGQVNFRKDIYGRDQRLLMALTDRDADSLVCNAAADEDRLMVDCPHSPSGFISTADTPALQPAGEVAGHPVAEL